MVGGTGLEPVTPSLSTQSSVRRCSGRIGESARLSRIRRRSERQRERKRTTILAILATLAARDATRPPDCARGFLRQGGVLGVGAKRRRTGSWPLGDAYPESPNGLPSESLQIAQRSPGCTTSPPSSTTRSRAEDMSATRK